MTKVINKHDGSTIEYDEKGDARAFAGAAAVDLFRVATLSASMNLFKAGMRLRGMSGAQALKEATKYTGKKYKRQAYDDAKADLQALLKERKGEFQPETLKG